MKIAYLDCSFGISGDMFLAALIDAGGDEQVLARSLKKLNVGPFSLSTRRVKRHALMARKLVLQIPEKHQHSRGIAEITRIIQQSRLSETVKKKSRAVFQTLATVEGSLHGEDFKKTHFHEIGSLDSIIDIVGSCLAVEMLGIEKLMAFNTTLGQGLINCCHGVLSAPAPAALELLKNRVVNLSAIPHELVTPTGAAILKVLTADASAAPLFKIKTIGYGAGDFKMEGISNLLRVIIGETAGSSYGQDEVTVVEANIDDTLPLNFEYIFEQLFARGALDVYLTNIIMKKNRPAVKLSVLAAANDVNRIISEIFRQSTTFGLRTYQVQRYKLAPRTATVATKYGKARVKIGSWEGNVCVSPEYEDCKRLAVKHNVPLRLVYEETKYCSRSLPPHPICKKRDVRGFSRCGGKHA